MYEKNQPSAMRRSGDEFLRRMRSSELPERSLPVMNRTSTNPYAASSAGCSNSGSNTGTGSSAMPSLAMVYAPVQEWRCLLTPSEALREGSLFRELIKPFQGRSVYHQSR